MAKKRRQQPEPVNPGAASINCPHLASFRDMVRKAVKFAQQNRRPWFVYRPRSRDEVRLAITLPGASQEVYCPGEGIDGVQDAMPDDQVSLGLVWLGVGDEETLPLLHSAQPGAVILVEHYQVGAVPDGVTLLGYWNNALAWMVTQPLEE